MPTVKELIYLCRDRGIDYSGKNKEQLIKHVKRSINHSPRRLFPSSTSKSKTNSKKNKRSSRSVVPMSISSSRSVVPMSISSTKTKSKKKM